MMTSAVWLVCISAAEAFLERPTLGLQGIRCCFLLSVGCVDAHWFVVSLKAFAVQSSLAVLFCRVVMPTGMKWLMPNLMWMLWDSELKHVLVLLIPRLCSSTGLLAAVLIMGSVDVA
ncbi:hypothetical protein Nepgr_033880 [Nepenthes gracilis]|uniref:Secreted protein n=1 Tax=Nepenthes gracilis TaxID=150966 RepID=A0AAD3TMM2_NEPGR|nr:hypothetical protein Nepgr_033880 [Nepenthes gracilis]